MNEFSPRLSHLTTPVPLSKGGRHKAAGGADDSTQAQVPGLQSSEFSGGDKIEKPKAAFLLPKESFSAVYSKEERVALANLMTFVEPQPEVLSAGGPPGDLTEVEALFTGWNSPRLESSLLQALPSLRMVFHAGGSVKFLASDELWIRGIRLTCTAQANAVPVAEFTLAQIILCLKHAFQSARVTRETRRFVRNDAAIPSSYGSVVGIISAGLIGSMVIERLRSLDVRVLCYDPILTAADATLLGVESCSLDDLFARSDVVTCHTPLLDQTTRLLREKHFAKMKSGASFINTARGAIVDESEMIAVLRRRPDLFAVLDVTDPEPPLADSPLFDLPNVLLTPHLAGSVGPECYRMGRMIVDEVRHYLAGAPLRGEVFREKLSLLA